MQYNPHCHRYRKGGKWVISHLMPVFCNGHINHCLIQQKSGLKMWPRLTIPHILKGMCVGPRCTILMHVNAYDLWCCVRVIPLNLYIFRENWSFRSLSRWNGEAISILKVIPAYNLMQLHIERPFSVREVLVPKSYSIEMVSHTVDKRNTIYAISSRIFEFLFV